ncbi:hypothetical protein [Bacillus sp. 2205SS5-2]|uniref:hypothetical protein n=1 Tax=Bacillus sp. 2205SS5-2 TaxID=3109031 RepID=UPI003005E983
MIEKLRVGLFSDEDVLRKVTLMMLDNVLNVPNSLVIELLKEAVNYSHKRPEILISLSSRSIPCEGLMPLVEILQHESSEDVREIALNLLRNVEPELLVKNEKLVAPFLTDGEQSFYRLLANGHKKDVWSEFEQTLVGLMQQEVGYERAERLAKVLATKGWIDDFVIDSVMNDDLNEGSISYEGLIMIFLIGILKKNKYLPILANLLYTEDDLILGFVEEALKRFQSEEMVEVVTPYLLDRDTSLFAAGIVGSVKSSYAREQLQMAYHKVDDGDEKAILIDALCCQLDVEALPEIQDYLQRGFVSGLIDTTEATYGYFRLLGLNHAHLQDWKASLQS